MKDTSRPTPAERGQGTQVPRTPDADLQPEDTGAERGNASQSVMKQTSKTAHEAGDARQLPDEKDSSKP